jgi:hypothetical protein
MAELKHNKIFTHDHINSRELSELYISDPTDRGRLFIILELPKHKIDQQAAIDDMINKAATYFETSNQEDPEVLLEEILQELNQILPDLGTSMKIRNWLATLDLAVGIFHQDSVYLASIGNVNALLVHNGQLTPILEKNTDINPTKIFADIVSGQLDDRDTLIVSTNSLFDYISREKIKQIVKKYTPRGSALKINELLETVPEFVTFNSLLVKKCTSADIELTVDDIRNKEESLDDIYPEAEESFLDTDKSGPDYRSSKSKVPGPRTKLVVDPKGLKNLKLFHLIGKFFGLIALFFKTIWKMLVYVFQKIKNGLLFVFSGKYRRGKEAETLDSIKNITDKKYGWWQNLSTKKKIAIISLFIILLVFLQGLVFLTQKKDVEQKDETFNNNLQEINNKFTEVEARLIYNDEEAAEEILLTIYDIIDNTPIGSPEQQAEIDTIEEKTFHKLNGVRHIHVVPSPVEIIIPVDSILSSQNIVQKDGSFYLLADNQIFMIKDDVFTPLNSFADGMVVESMTDWPNTNKLVMSSIDANDQLNYFAFDLNNQQALDTLKPVENNTEVTDLAVYGNNLYVLDASNNQVFKYPERGNGFGNGSVWLKEELDISQSNSLTVDGSIYTIENNGNIRNFTKGQEDAFDYHQPRPVIGPGATIKTFRDSEYLYIIDPQNMRIVILDKEGNIKDQYASQKFDNLVDLAVDPEEKAIYLLNGKHLYLLAINQ